MMRQVLTLGMANVADAAVQMLTPVVLVRVLDESGFGEYRLLWLTAGTLLAVLPFGISGSLSFFLPRHRLREQALFVRQTLCYMAAVAILAGVVLSDWNPWLPQSLHSLAGSTWAAPLFWGLWVFGSTLDHLANAERRYELQAGLVFGLAMLRGAAVIVAALAGGIHAVIVALALVAAVKALVLVALPTARYGRSVWLGGMPRLMEQARFALPVGAGNAVYLLRLQADQWLVVILFGAAQYGIYSIGTVALSLAGIIRTTVSQVIFPEMSKAQAEGDLAKVLSLNNRSNIACSLFTVAVGAFIFAAAEPLVRLIYTDAYADAIPVLRLTVIAYLIASVEVSTVMLVLRQGPFLLYTSVVFLALGVATSYLGARAWGLPGAVAGAIAGNLIAICVVYLRASRLVSIPVRALQDWGTLGRIAGAALAAGAAAYAVLVLTPASLGTALALLFAAVAFGGAYLASLLGLGLGRLVSAILGLPPAILRPFSKHSRRAAT